MARQLDDLAQYYKDREQRNRSAVPVIDEELEMLEEMEREMASDSGSGVKTVTGADGTQYKIKTGKKKNSEGGHVDGLPAYIILTGLLGGIGLIIASLVFQKFFAQRNLSWLVFAGFGLTFFSGGMGALFAGELIGLIFMAVGTMVGGGAAYYTYAPPEGRELLMEYIVPVLMLSVFLIVGLCLTLIPPFLYRKNKRKYSLKVEAEVTGKEMRRSRDSDGHTHRAYYLSWKYYINGKWYHYRSNQGRSPERREAGDRGFLYVNPANVSDCWERWSLLHRAILLLFGIFTTGAAGFGMYALLMRVLGIW